jgi:hypothetical protein
MKATTRIITSIIVLLSLNACHQNGLIIENTTNLERPDELIVLKRADLEKQLGQPVAAGKYILVSEDGVDAPVVVQHDDMDGDGQWDEIAWLSSFTKNQGKLFNISISDAPAAVKAVVRAHVRHIKRNADSTFGSPVLKDTMPPGNPPTDFTRVPLPPYLTEGPAWENDKVAFRLYFDTRNAKDVFGKTVPGMVLDSVGANHNNSYHAPGNWGMDVLHVGKSLGAGGLAFYLQQPGGKDTLLRLGGSMVKKETYEVLADGPVRAVFKMQYDCDILGNPVTVTDVTSIWGGQYFYESDVTLSAVPAGLQLVSGIANFNSETIGYLHDNDVRTSFLSGAMSENKDMLGLAIAVPDKTYSNVNIKIDSTGDIQNTTTMAQQVTAGKPVSHRFYALWAPSDPKFTSNEYFWNYLKRQIGMYGTPLKAKWK